MNQSITIEEKYSKYWPWVAVVSFLFSVILFITYQFLDSVLLIGYLRLAAFAFFAISLLSFFKVKDGKVEITVKLNGESVESTYKVQNEVLVMDEHPLSDFFKLKVDQLPNTTLYNDFMKNDKCVRFRREDENAWYYFNAIESRVIPLSSDNAQKLCNFLEEAREA